MRDARQTSRATSPRATPVCGRLREGLTMNRQNALSTLTLALILGSAAHAAPLFTVSSATLDAIVLPAVEETTIEGEIKSVDSDSRSFVIVEGEAVHAIKFGADTKFELDGKEAKPKDALKKGRKVRVTKDGDNVLTVEVTSK